MSRKITVPLTEDGIDQLIKSLDDYERWLNRKTQELVTRLADYGVKVAQVTFATAAYDGEKDVHVHFEPRGENTAAVIATGHTALILEFGAGVTYGYGHPNAGENGMGPGTYPGQKHALDPNGWYLPKAVQAMTGKEKSYGNPPYMAMYGAAKTLEQEFERIAMEVFST